MRIRSDVTSARKWNLRLGPILGFTILSALLLLAPEPTRSCFGEDLKSPKFLASDSIEIGIDGIYRVGRWTAISFPGQGDGWELETRDGDSTPVRFTGSSPTQRPDLTVKSSSPVESSSPVASSSSVESSSPVASSRLKIAAMIKSGTEAAPLLIRQNNAIRYDGRLPAIGSLYERPTMIPDTQAWIVAIGGSLDLETIGVNVINKEPLVAVSNIQDATMLPEQSLGWDGVDLVLINSDSSSFIGELSEQQSEALIQWVRGGGRMLMMLGDQTRTLLDVAPWLGDLIPFSPDEIVTLSPSGLETFMGSQTPLKPYSGVRLPRDVGEILVRGKTTRRISVPLASRFIVGFGELTILAANLDQESFRNWPERMDLLQTLTGPILLAPTNQTNANTSLAYNDLAGQLRISMDQYDSAIRMNFSVLSLIMIALVALIGPIDYWFINSVMGRPLLGWLTFPITIIGLSVGLIALSNTGDGAAIEKRIGILDIDLSHSKSNAIGDASDLDSRVTMLSQLYCKNAIRLDATFGPSDWLARDQATKSSAVLSSLGYPGTAFGSIRLSNEDDQIGSYQIELPIGQDLPTIQGFPIPPRSSKSLVGRFYISPPTNGHRQQSDRGVERRRGSELLQGTLTNPLDVDILDGRLIYQNWVYLLPTRFVAGGTIPKLDLLRQKNLRWLLAKQKALESSSQTEAWMSTNQSTDRILEMMLFHKAAGGGDYTSLDHRPLGHLDLSHVLDRDRCLIVGRLEVPVCELDFTNSMDQSEPAIELQRTSMVRVLLPAAFAENE